MNSGRMTRKERDLSSTRIHHPTPGGHSGALRLRFSAMVSDQHLWEFCAWEAICVDANRTVDARVALLDS